MDLMTFKCIAKYSIDESSFLHTLERNTRNSQTRKGSEQNSPPNYSQDDNKAVCGYQNSRDGSIPPNLPAWFP
jgi:hypothetical protein